METVSGSQQVTVIGTMQEGKDDVVVPVDV